MSALSDRMADAMGSDDVDVLKAILDGQRKHQETMDAILEKFDTIANEIKPMIEDLKNNPMLKMLGLGKGR